MLYPPTKSILVYSLNHAGILEEECAFHLISIEVIGIGGLERLILYRFTPPPPHCMPSSSNKLTRSALSHYFYHMYIYVPVILMVVCFNFSFISSIEKGRSWTINSKEDVDQPTAWCFVHFPTPTHICIRQFRDFGHVSNRKWTTPKKTARLSFTNGTYPDTASYLLYLSSYSNTASTKLISGSKSWSPNSQACYVHDATTTTTGLLSWVVEAYSNNIRMYLYFSEM